VGELVDTFGGKVSGELIKAVDWNGLLGVIEQQLDSLRSDLEGRLDALEARADAADARLNELDGRVAPLEALATSVRQRFRRVDLTTTRSRFAIGERGEIIAQVTDLEGNAVDFTDTASRPWVDFVTVWGALKAVPGFETRGGAGDRTVSVRVNASGEARVRLRADHAEAFAEEQEAEVEAVLGATVGTGAAARPVSQILLEAATPTSDGVAAAFQIIAQEYDRQDTFVMQSYLDAYYVQNPAQSFGRFTSVFQHRWRDYRATVLAFVKPDADPLSADGTQATASIQVTFRDWIHPWIIVDYLPGQVTLAEQYRNRFRGRITGDYEASLAGVFDIIKEEAVGKGLIAQQRELAAAQTAIEQIGFTDPPDHLDELIVSVGGGIKVQQSLFYSQAVMPVAGGSVDAVQIIGQAGAAGGIAAGKAAEQVRTEYQQDLAAAEQRVVDNVRAEQTTFRNDLLRDDGPIMAVTSRVQEFETRANNFEVQLGQKAGFETVNEILRLSQR